MSSSSGIQSDQYKKREKGKQSQPFGRHHEGPSFRSKQTDSRQTYATGDSGHNPKQNRRKDQKYSAESGGTDFNQNQTMVNQLEEVKNMRGPNITSVFNTNFEQNEVLTPRRQELLDNESRKTSGASTPSRDGADTPTRK